MKTYYDRNVYEAAKARLRYTYENFDNVCVSFSNGKDSGVLINLAIEVAREMNKLPVKAMYIDFEAQYEYSIAFTERVFNREEVEGWWICLPIRLRNAVSQFQPHWTCWDEGCKSDWVRDMPTNKHVVSDLDYFDFYEYAMEFEDFVPKFGKWFHDYSGGGKTACVIGIRSNESLNRFRTIKNDRKVKYNNLGWTTKIDPKSSDEIYNAYPIYDWEVRDIWIANGKNKWDYNHIYDLMYMAGVPLSKQRLCQPYGDDQRQGLYLFKALEHETWAKVVNRVEGANFGNKYTEKDSHILGNRRVDIPKGHTYESYARFLLKTMPPYLAEHYWERINKFLKWWEKKGVDRLPDTADRKLEASKKAPSWRRICGVLLRNDYWCRGLSFSQTKRDAEKQLELITKYTNLL